MISSTVTRTLTIQPPGPIRVQTRSPAAYSALEREVRVGRPAAVRTHKRERAYKSGKIDWSFAQRYGCQLNPPKSRRHDHSFKHVASSIMRVGSLSDGNTIMTTEMGLVRPETLRHQVENVLEKPSRSALRTRRAADRTRVVRRRWASAWTLVREALRRLEAEKLVCSVPQKGPVVAIMSKQEATELYAIRGLLEGFAAGEFA